MQEAASQVPGTLLALTHADVEVTDSESVRSQIVPNSPDVVINCAAFVRVDECESRPRDAFAVNALGALNVARAATAAEASCVYISTDFVFDGTKDEPYTERDSPNPINIYGASKLAGEYLTRQACSRSLIARTAGLYGEGGARSKGGNFVDAVLTKARRGEHLKVVHDLHISLTYARDAANSLLQLLQDEVLGTVHLVNAGVTTWWEVAAEACRIAGLANEIEAVSSRDLPRVAPRPAFSALASLRGGRAVAMRPWQAALLDHVRRSSRRPE